MKQSAHNTAIQKTSELSAMTIPFVEKLRLRDRVTVTQIVGSQATEFVALVDEFDADSLYITRPDPRTHVNYGKHAVVSFSRPDAMYEFDSILDMPRENSSRWLQVRPNSLVRRVQRRGAVRLDIRIGVRVAAIDRPLVNPIKLTGLKWEQTETIDFSASGALLVATPSIIVGDCIVLRFDQKQLPIVPELILASWRRLLKRASNVYVGVEFLTSRGVDERLLPHESPYVPVELKALNDQGMNALSRFVFHEELRLRQEGRL